MSVALHGISRNDLPDYSGLPPVAGYTSWYDFGDFSTLTVSGSKITAVRDKGSGGNNLSVTTGSILLGRTYPSQRYAAWFGNGSEYMSSSAVASDTSQTMFVAACVFGVSAGRTLVGSSADGGNQLRVDATTGRLTTNRTDQALIGTQSNAAVSEDVPFVAAQAVTATQVTHYLGATSETDVVAPGFSAGTLTIGRAPSIVSGGGEGMAGWIGGVLIYDTTLSGGDITSTVDWMTEVWLTA